ncbi:hypothetical protein ADUPG1_013825 [Aduncisulcus paluster]|uniref:GINS subunit domain-containing protein n=1 Tax=Aduncisulcus paluster TaxID=2918883 RepID=A0ABQ5K8C7_9EUKA|nr:hypothetical protein ADUPG1_013825 [Aduncisulcus paluster]
MDEHIKCIQSAITLDKLAKLLKDESESRDLLHYDQPTLYEVRKEAQALLGYSHSIGKEMKQREEGHEYDTLLANTIHINSLRRMTHFIAALEHCRMSKLRAALWQGRHLDEFIPLLSDAEKRYAEDYVRAKKKVISSYGVDYYLPPIPPHPKRAKMRVRCIKEVDFTCHSGRKYYLYPSTFLQVYSRDGWEMIAQGLAETIE